MKVDFAPEVTALIDQRALKAGITAEAVVLEAVAAWLAQTADARGKALPQRHLAGGIITPQ